MIGTSGMIGMEDMMGDTGARGTMRRIAGETRWMIWRIDRSIEGGGGGDDVVR